MHKTLQGGVRGVDPGVAGGRGGGGGVPGGGGGGGGGVARVLPGAQCPWVTSTLCPATHPFTAR